MSFDRPFVMTYDVRNRREIGTLAPNTRAAAEKFYDYCLRNKVQLLITQGIRGIEEQKRNVAKGVSWTLQSFHLVGQAFDFVPVIDGKVAYDKYSESPWKEAIQFAKTCGFEWGGDWVKGRDMPHLQFTFKGYGTDKSLPVSKPSVSKKEYRSIVDYLKDHGKDSSLTARIKLASSYGIFGYKGTADQNIKLLSLLNK